MKVAKLFRFSALMFFAAAVYLLLTAVMQEGSRLIYLGIGLVCIVLSVLMSVRSRETSDK